MIDQKLEHEILKKLNEHLGTLGPIKMTFEFDEEDSYELEQKIDAEFAFSLTVEDGKINTELLLSTDFQVIDISNGTKEDCEFLMRGRAWYSTEDLKVEDITMDELNKLEWEKEFTPHFKSVRRGKW